MMWIACLSISLASVIIAVLFFFLLKLRRAEEKREFNLFNFLLAGIFASTFFMFLPTHIAMAGETSFRFLRSVLLSVFNSMQVFAFGCDFENVAERLATCPDGLSSLYQFWASILFVGAPIFTFSFVLSLFQNVSAFLRYLRAYFKNVFVFSELNEKSLVLASDIKKKYPLDAIVFTDVFQGNDEKNYELMGRAKEIGAICFKKDILVVSLSKHSKKKEITFFAIDNDETENLNQAVRLIETYRDRKNTNLYVFSTKVEGELLLTSVEKGEVRVRRINEVQSLVSRVLYEQGNVLFDGAAEKEDGAKQISAVVIGMGNHGKEMVKALAWFGQMDGYRLKIHAFDKDPLAEEKFIALAPELMSPVYNGVNVDGEAQYEITVHPNSDVQTSAFSKKISEITDATYVFVSLGNDDVNVQTAVNLRMYFERIRIHPVIQVVLQNSRQKKALAGIQNYRGQAYDLQFIGDMDSSYTADVIMHSELEAEALQRHLKWGKEEEFWTYEYNYRSSMASAIHMKARIHCGIPGASKKEEELTEKERNIIETLEHRRWNAYMRAEGYVYSGSKDKSSRNDLAKMHHDLIDYAALSDEDKRKDSQIGTF